MLAVQEYAADDSEGNITRMWSVLKVPPLESNPGFSLRQEDPEVFSDGGEDDRDGWFCRRAWPHIQMPSRPAWPQAIQPRVEVPTLPQRVKKDLLEHHHLCKLMSTLGIDICKEYRYSCTPAVLSRVRQANKICTICNKVCSTTQNLRIHIRGQHMKDSRFKYSKCYHVAGDVHSLKVHALTHEEAAKNTGVTSVQNPTTPRVILISTRRSIRGGLVHAPIVIKPLRSRVALYPTSNPATSCMEDQLPRSLNVMCAAENTPDRLNCIVTKRKNMAPLKHLHFEL